MPANEIWESYEKAGLCVIACKPKTKQPMGKSWQQQTLEDAKTRLDNLEEALALGQPNYGILAGECSNNAVCVDVDSMGSETMERIDLQPLLQNAVVIQTGREGGEGRHIWFRSAEPLGVASYRWYTNDTICGEVRGKCNTLVPPSIHPLTGQAYQLLSGNWEDLPILPLDEIHRLFPKKPQISLIEPNLSFEEGKDLGKMGNVPFEAEFRPDYSSIRWKDLFRDLGMIRSEHGDKAHVICPNHAAHSPNPKNPTADTSTTIITMPDGLEVFKCLHAHCEHITMSYLTNLFSDRLQGYSEAWTPTNPIHAPQADRVRVVAEERPKAPTDKAKPAAKTEESRLPYEDTGLANPEKYRLFGFTKLWAEHITRSAVWPQPVLTAGAVLAACGSLLGRKAMTVDGLATNLYNFGVAPSCAGKNHIQAQVDYALTEAMLGHYMTGDDFTSDTSLVRVVENRPDSLLLIDECAEVLSGMLTENFNEQTQSNKIGRLLLNWFSKATPHSPWRGKEFADKEKGRTEIYMPCISIYGTTIPEKFFRVMQPIHVKDGMLNRFLLFHTHDTVNFPNHNVTSGTPCQEILNQLLECSKFNHTLLGNNIALGETVGKPIPRILGYDRPTRNLWDYLRNQSQKIRLKQEPLFELHLRKEEQVKKISLIIAAANGETEITMKHADAALDVVEDSIRVLAWHLINDSGGHSVFSEQTQKIQNFITQTATRGATKSELARAFRSIQAKDRNLCIMQLKEAQQIEDVVFVTPDGGKSQKVWRDIQFGNA